jgi:hypothetical protein
VSDQAADESSFVGWQQQAVQALEVPCHSRNKKGEPAAAAAVVAVVIYQMSSGHGQALEAAVACRQTVAGCLGLCLPQAFGEMGSCCDLWVGVVLVARMQMLSKDNPPPHSLGMSKVQVAQAWKVPYCCVLRIGATA